jgi:hypothetical protein
LGSHTSKWLVGWSIYRPQLKYSRWKTVLQLSAAHRTGAPDMPRVLAIEDSRWSFRRWRTGHGAPDGPVCTGQPMLACRIFAITFSSELRFWWSCTFWKAYEILYNLELKLCQFEYIWFCEILLIQSALPLNFVNFTFVLHLCISLLLLDVLDS